MAKQSKPKPPVEVTISDEAVGQATVETVTPAGDETVQTVPVSEAKAHDAEAERVNWNSLKSTDDKPQRPPRRTRDQRARERTAAREERKVARQERQARGTPPRPAVEEEERTVTLTLTTRQWQRLDRLMARGGQEMGRLLTRLLAPHLR